jgi:ribosome-associated translation inhibitor RaiA
MGVQHVVGDGPSEQRLSVGFDGVPPSPALEEKAERIFRKLLQHYPRIMNASVIITARHHHHHQGNLFHVSVRLHLPDGDLCITRDPERNHAHEDPYVALRDAHDAARRQLDALRHKSGGKGVQHALSRHQNRPSALRRQQEESEAEERHHPAEPEGET